jgi:hypothetical protein
VIASSWLQTGQVAMTSWTIGRSASRRCGAGLAAAGRYDDDAHARPAPHDQRSSRSLVG